MTETTPVRKIAVLAAWRTLPEPRRNLPNDCTTDVEAAEDLATVADTIGKKKALEKDGAQNNKILRR